MVRVFLFVCLTIIVVVRTAPVCKYAPLYRYRPGELQESTGWATVKSVSIALAEMGAVGITDETVLLLAQRQRRDEPTHLFRHCGRTHNSDDDDVAGPATRLVHWPSILCFLEEGPSTERAVGYANVDVRSKRPISPSPGEEKQSAADGEAQSDNSAKTRDELDDIERPVWKAESPFLAETPAEETDPLRTDNEPALPPTTDGDSVRGVINDRAGVVVSVGGCRMDSATRVEQGLRDVEAGLRASVQHRPSSRWVARTMDKIREVLTSAGAHCERQELFADTTRLRDGRAAGGAKDRARGRCRQKCTPLVVDIGVNEKKSCDLAGDRCASPSCQTSLLHEEALASAASAAGKKGDVSALHVRI